MTTRAPREAFDTSALRDHVVTAGSHWRRLDVVAETGSTNADLIKRAAAGEDVDGVVLIAENQTAGRGRRGRSWSAVPGAQLAMSFGVATADVPSKAWGWLPLLTGVAVVDAVRDIGLRAAGVPVGLKWPNDVLAGADGSAAKLAGILAEVAPAGRVIVVGLGLNVTVQDDELPPPIVATSLLALGLEGCDRDSLARALLGELARRIAAWSAAGGADAELQADYGSRSLTIGTRVRAFLPGDAEITGTAEAIDEQGRLVVQTAQGVVMVSAGDVVHLRPGGDTTG